MWAPETSPVWQVCSICVGIGEADGTRAARGPGVARGDADEVGQGGERRVWVRWAVLLPGQAVLLGQCRVVLGQVQGSLGRGVRDPECLESPSLSGGQWWNTGCPGDIVVQEAVWQPLGRGWGGQGGWTWLAGWGEDTGVEQHRVSTLTSTSRSCFPPLLHPVAEAEVGSLHSERASCLWDYEGTGSVPWADALPSQNYDPYSVGVWALHGPCL